jgi:hypothetical protein
MADLRKENAARPECSFKWSREPGSMEYGEVIINLLALAKLLSYEEDLAIHDQQPQLALDDLKVGWKVEDGLAKEPTILSGLIGMGVTAIQIGAVQEGLYYHAWNDAQLAELDADMGRIDFLTNVRQVLQGDFAINNVPLIERYAANRWRAVEDTHRNILQLREIDRFERSTPEATLAKQDNRFRQTKEQVDDTLDWNSELMLWSVYWWRSNGELYRDLAYYAQMVLPSAKEALDPAAHRVYPEKIRPASNDAYGSVLNAIEKSASSQVELDEARIACRLERYRLAHQNYPASLDELVPAYGNDLPHDVMNGEPYHYKRDGDTYLLYSVAWNQKDDGGDGGKYRGYLTDSPDWVWPNQPNKK